MVNFGHRLGMFRSSPSPINNIIQFADTNQPMNGEVYVQVDSVLGQSKYIF
jgi:hypothetical protein